MLSCGDGQGHHNNEFKHIGFDLDLKMSPEAQVYADADGKCCSLQIAMSQQEVLG